MPLSKLVLLLLVATYPTTTRRLGRLLLYDYYFADDINVKDDDLSHDSDRSPPAGGYKNPASGQVQRQISTETHFFFSFVTPGISIDDRVDG